MVVVANRRLAAPLQLSSSQQVTLVYDAFLVRAKKKMQPLFLPPFIFYLREPGEVIYYRNRSSASLPSAHSVLEAHFLATCPVTRSPLKHMSLSGGQGKDWLETSTSLHELQFKHRSAPITTSQPPPNHSQSKMRLTRLQGHAQAILPLHFFRLQITKKIFLKSTNNKLCLKETIFTAGLCFERFFVFGNMRGFRET